VIRHKPHCAVTQSTGMHDDADCTCGSTRRRQRKDAPPSPGKAIIKLREALDAEMKTLRACATEAAVSLSLDANTIIETCIRMRGAITDFQTSLFSRPELPLTGRHDMTEGKRTKGEPT